MGILDNCTDFVSLFYSRQNNNSSLLKYLSSNKQQISPDFGIEAKQLANNLLKHSDAQTTGILDTQTSLVSDTQIRALTDSQTAGAHTDMLAMQQSGFTSGLGNTAAPSLSSLYSSLGGHMVNDVISRQNFAAVSQPDLTLSSGSTLSTGSGSQSSASTSITSTSTTPTQKTPELKNAYIEKTYTCKICSQLFCSKPDLMYHIQHIHKQDPKPFSCKLCHKKFANSSYLSQHNRIHQGIKPYRCDICDRRFTQLVHLQQHIRTHTGEKPYKCRFQGCEKAFSQLSNLQSHMRSHMTDRPFRCNSCYKCFADEETLRIHIPKHSETKHLKTHICKVCGKSYTQETYLERHMVKHAGQAPAVLRQHANHQYMQSSLRAQPPPPAHQHYPGYDPTLGAFGLRTEHLGIKREPHYLPEAPAAFDPNQQFNCSTSMAANYSCPLQPTEQNPLAWNAALLPSQPLAARTSDAFAAGDFLQSGLLNSLHSQIKQLQRQHN